MIKDGDFVEIEYDAYIVASNKLFDTTNPKIARENGLKGDVEPQKLIIGAGHVIRGLEEELIKHNIKDSFEIEITSEKAFGSRNPLLIKLMPVNDFRKKNMKPFPGLTLDFGGMHGTILSVSGGRVRIDFNHPLAGRSVKYLVKVNRKIDELKEQIETILGIRLNSKDSKIEIKDKKAEITIEKKIPQQYLDFVKEEIKKYTGAEAEFKGKEEKTEKKEAPKKETKKKITKKE